MNQSQSADSHNFVADSYAKAAEDAIVVIDGLAVDEIKTRPFKSFLDKVGADSKALMKEVYNMLSEKGYVIGNVDATIIAQAPKMRPYIDDMIANVAGILNITKEQVNIKATTEEHLGFTGEGLGISASAVCILETLREAGGLVGASSVSCCAAGGCPISNNNGGR